MKRFLFAVAALALVFALAACGHTALSAAAPSEVPGTTPTSSTSRNVRNAPVTVTETYANTDVVANTVTETATTAPAEAESTVAPAESTAAPVESTAAPVESTAPPVDTPATGDFPITYFAGVLGLILICSAGLIMLKRV